MVNTLLAPFIEPAIRSHIKFYPRGPFVSVILAQLIEESDWGRKVSGTYNYFGIKATQEQIDTGKARKVITREFLNDQWRVMDLYFADYDSIEECFDAHATLLTHPWYQRCIEATTPARYCVALQECGYATAPNYAQALIDIITRENLTQFD